MKTLKKKKKEITGRAEESFWTISFSEFWTPFPNQIYWVPLVLKIKESREFKTRDVYFIFILNTWICWKKKKKTCSTSVATDGRSEESLICNNIFLSWSWYSSP